MKIQCKQEDMGVPIPTNTVGEASLLGVVTSGTGSVVIHLRARPVSTTNAKRRFIRSQANRIAAVASNPGKSVKLVKALADEMLGLGLYLKSTSKIDRCVTIKRLIMEFGFWDDDVASEVDNLLWPIRHR
jgi:hypothetical protein